MILVMFKVFLLFIFLLESFIEFTLGRLIEVEQGKPKYKVGIWLIGGYIVRLFILSYILKGMGLI